MLLFYSPIEKPTKNAEKQTEISIFFNKPLKRQIWLRKGNTWN